MYVHMWCICNHWIVEIAGRFEARERVTTVLELLIVKLLVGVSLKAIMCYYYYNLVIAYMLCQLSATLISGGRYS